MKGSVRLLRALPFVTCKNAPGDRLISLPRTKVAILALFSAALSLHVLWLFSCGTPGTASSARAPLERCLLELGPKYDGTQLRQPSHIHSTSCILSHIAGALKPPRVIDLEQKNLRFTTMASSSVDEETSISGITFLVTTILAKIFRFYPRTFTKIGWAIDDWIALLRLVISYEYTGVEL